MRIALPIMVQSGITNLVGMLDNIMVGRVGTDSMSGVAIVNQLLFIVKSHMIELTCFLLPA